MSAFVEMRWSGLRFRLVEVCWVGRTGRTNRATMSPESSELYARELVRRGVPVWCTLA